MSWKEQIAGLAVLGVIAGGGYGTYKGISHVISRPVVPVSVVVPVKPKPVVKEKHVDIPRHRTNTHTAARNVAVCAQVKKARAKGASDEYIAQYAVKKGYNYDRALARIRACR